MYINNIYYIYLYIIHNIIYITHIHIMFPKLFGSHTILFFMIKKIDVALGCAFLYAL